MKNKNSDTLSDFIDYCYKHPNERFWQALRNWSKAEYIKINNPIDNELGDIDTFYFEGKDK